jgi:hypothetical protein
MDLGTLSGVQIEPVQGTLMWAPGDGVLVRIVENSRAIYTMFDQFEETRSAGSFALIQL